MWVIHLALGGLALVVPRPIAGDAAKGRSGRSTVACTAIVVEAKAPPPQLHPAYMALRDFPGQWFVACVHSHQEFNAAERLLKLNVAYYLPQYDTSRRINRKPVVVKTPA